MSDLLANDNEDLVQEPRTRRGGTATLVAPPRKRRKSESLAKLTPAIKELIERKLEGDGATLKEMATYVQQRRGTDTSPESNDPPAEKKRLADLWSQEVQLCIKLVKEHLKSYGETVLDGLKHEIGIGDQIRIKDGHYSKVF